MGSTVVEGSFRAWLNYGIRYLESKGIADAKTDAWLLLEYAANINRSFYYMHMHDKIDPGDAEDYRGLLARRGEHVPVQYITGSAWIYGYEFRVNSHVLIPRQDTEVLIEEAQKRIRPGMKVLDLCTGSGCILLTLLKEADITGVGADLSREALLMTELNRKRMQVKATLIESDLFEKVGGRFDMIVSNPPYIASEVVDTLEPEVKDQEPRMALDGGSDGLDFYRRIIREAPSYLTEDGFLLMEIGYDQGEAVRKMLDQAGYTEITLIRDLAGLDRVAAARRGLAI